MKLAVKFKGLDHSESLVDYVTERFSRLSKYEIRSLKTQVTFSTEGHNCVSDVYVHGINVDFRAKACADSFHESVDQCARKIERQLEKEKSKIKNHRSFSRSAAGRLNQLIKSERKNKKAA